MLIMFAVVPMIILAFLNAIERGQTAAYVCECQKNSDDQSLPGFEPHGKPRLRSYARRHS